MISQERVLLMVADIAAGDDLAAARSSD